MADAIPFEARKRVALELLQHSENLTRKAGSFLGQITVDPTPMTHAQAEWFTTLAERAGVAFDVEGHPRD